MSKLRIVIADDERPARSLLLAMLRAWDDVEIVGEATTGTEAVELIESSHPDLALLDLQMPELDGLGVVKLLRPDALPLIAFVTAYDEYAVRAFELNAVDYLLKPVERARLRQTLERAQERLEQANARAIEAERLNAAASHYEKELRPAYLQRLPVRRREEILILPINQVASIVAEGELLHITTNRNERYTISYRLKDLELRLDPEQFVRLGRGTLANIEAISRISPMPGGTYLVTLKNDQQLAVSRLQARVVRDQLLRL